VSDARPASGSCVNRLPLLAPKTHPCLCSLHLKPNILSTHTHTPATDPKAGEQFWTTYTKYYGTPYFLDDILVRAFGGLKPFTEDVVRVQVIVKSLESSLQYATIMSAFDAAITAAT